MTTARIMAAALASIAAFLLGNSYAACLLSLPGSPAVNLTEAAKRLPSFLSARPRPPLARGCRARDGARGRLRRVVRLGVVAHAREPGAAGRGARQRPLEHRPRGQAIHEPRGPRQKHRPHEALWDGDGPARPRPTLRAQPERARGGRLRLREDEGVLRAQHHAAELEPPRDRPEGRDAAPDGAHVAGRWSGSVPGWARRPRQQALLVRGRPPLRERRCP